MKFDQKEYISDLSTFRYATKKFDSQKKIANDDWNTLQECLRLSPSSYGLQPWKFIIVTNQALKDQLKAHSWNQSQVADCSHLVVIASLKKMTLDYIDKFLKKTAQVRDSDLTKLQGYRDVIAKDLIHGSRSKEILSWSQKQSYLAFGNLMTTAAIMHIDACPLEGIEPAKYDSVLGLENSEYQTAAACALGYRHAEDKYAAMKKVRFDASDVFEFRT